MSTSVSPYAFAERLTMEDRAVLALLLECPTDEALARRMCVSVRTARRRIARVLDVLGVESRFAAGVLAGALGLVPQPSASTSVSSADRDHRRAASSASTAWSATPTPGRSGRADSATSQSSQYTPPRSAS